MRLLQKVYAYIPAGRYIRNLSDYSVIQTDSAMDVLVYDFSLEIGDTLTYYIMGDVVAKAVSVRTESASIYVGRQGYSSVNHHYTAEDSVVYLSENSARRQILLHGLSYSTQNNLWIEGIGGIRGFDEGSQIIISDYGKKTLLCFSDDSGVAFQTEYDFDNEPDDCFCNGYGGDVPEEMEKLNFTIFPNPVSDRLHISVQSSNGKTISIQLLDLMGTCLYQNNIMNTDIEYNIDMKQLPSGLYILHIQQIDSEYNYKIIKL